MSFPEAVEREYFEKISFRVKKKIFVTPDEKEKVAVLKFSMEDQRIFADISNGAIYLVSGAWGEKGFTPVNLKKINREMMINAVRISIAALLPENYLKQ